MMAQSRAESTRDTYNYGQYLNQFPPNTIKVIREFERIQKKICRHKMSIMFNEICINEEMLPKYTYFKFYTYIYIYIIFYTYTHIYIYIYIYIKYVYNLVWLGFYSISTIIGYLMPSPLYTYILNIYMICNHILKTIFLNECELFFSSS